MQQRSNELAVKLEELENTLTSERSRFLDEKRALQEESAQKEATAEKTLKEMTASREAEMQRIDAELHTVKAELEEQRHQVTVILCVLR